LKGLEAENRKLREARTEEIGNVKLLSELVPGEHNQVKKACLNHAEFWKTSNANPT